MKNPGKTMRGSSIDHAHTVVQATLTHTQGVRQTQAGKEVGEDHERQQQYRADTQQYRSHLHGLQVDKVAGEDHERQQYYGHDGQRHRNVVEQAATRWVK